MEIDELAARVGRRYWPLLLAAVVITMLAVNAYIDRQPDLKAASARLVVAVKGTDTMSAEDAASFMVSQVKATATGSGLVGRAIGQVQVKRDADEVASRVDVKGIGTSRVVELSVSDTSGATARRLTDAIAAQVVNELNATLTSGPQAVVQRIDAQLNDLQTRAGRLRAKVRANPSDTYSAQRLIAVEGQLEDLRGQRRTTLEQMAENGQSSVTQPASNTPVDNGRTAMLVLAALAGLIIGILLATLMEALHPTVPGARRVAGRLGVPLLGNADGSEDELTEMGRRIRLAAGRSGVSDVALIAVLGTPVPAALHSRVAAAVYGDPRVIADEAAHLPDPDAPGSSRNNGNGGDDNGFGVGSPERTGATSLVRRPPTLAKTQARAASPPIQVHVLEDVETSAATAGLIVVAGPVTSLSALRSVSDLMAASGWPLLGIVAVNGPVRS